jgi:multidrug efflux pump subunit AcrA (membrane-fusion protein)
MNILPEFKSANFKPGYSRRLFKTDELNGRRISFGKTIAEDSYYIPVYFRIDYNQELIDGTYAEVYLIGQKIDNVIVVPNTALMEEYGKIYVFTEDDDGEFIKKYISTGHTNGEFTEVTGGLEENESIVATGAYYIKLSLTNIGAPEHTHNH